MAQFNPSRKFPTDFNKGNKYKAGDAVQSKTINDLIESALWVQDLAFGETTILGVISYKVEILADSSLWREANGAYIITIPSTEHKLKTINSVILAIFNKNENHYENADFTYKVYHSGAVTIVLDKKADCRIIIEGE